MHTKKELDERLKLAGVRPLKNLGQNFLVNGTICKKIVDLVKDESPKSVVEVGPGLGALTDDLVLGTWKLMLIEIDGGLTQYWQAQNSSLEVINKDALKVDWNSLKFETPAVLVSNLPYSIAASLVVDLSTHPHPFEALILMFQKEVAQRIQSLPHEPDYGMLSVVAQVHWEIEKTIDAGPQDFFPVPHIGSRVLRFKKKTVDLDSIEFLKFVKLAFSHRRKKLFSNLSGMCSRLALQAFFEEEKLSLDARPQELSPAQFVSAFRSIKC